METVFLVCAITGGTLVVCLLFAGMFGFASEHDVDHDTDADTDADHDSDTGHGNLLFGMLSVRTLTSALLFFGLGGMTARYYGASDVAAFGIAFGSGAAVFYLVALAMRAIKQLKSDGTVRVARAVGSTGTVYLRIPGARTGSGKVHLALQNRTVEYQAVTAGGELPTGLPVKVVAIVNSDTVEVEPT
ncbi:MAG TPA: NfeD family protein [Gemmata sp.]